MLDKIAIILPVRDQNCNRTERLKRCLSSWLDVSENKSDVFVIVDSDEINKYSFVDNMHPNVFKKIVPAGITLMQKINVYALEIASNYKYVAFIGDDIVFRTVWEKKFIDFLSENKYSMAYGNDMVHHQHLATHPCITSDLIKAVGFFGCPALQHNFFDNYWMDIVPEVGSVNFFEDVVMEHMHPCVNKENLDELYQQNSISFNQDHQAYIQYINSNKGRDVEKILRERNNQ